MRIKAVNIRPIARQLAHTEGAEIAEVAVVLPLVFMLLMGIIWFGRAFNIYSTIQQAAQQGAITAARATCATCGANPGFPATATVDSAITAVIQASNLDPTQIPANSSPPAPFSCVSPPPALAPCATTSHQITVCQQALLNYSASGTQPAQCGVVVGFQYPFKFYLPFTSLNLQPIVLSAQAQSRMEN
jgi:Flp pilus assembly protein TadG